MINRCSSTISNGEVTVMLKRKMLRDIKANFAQFFSIMLLSLIAMWCYTGFQANVIGGVPFYEFKWM